MQQIDTFVNVSTNFLKKAAEPEEKEIWKRVYVTYLHYIGKSAEEAKKERTKLTTLLPIFQSLDQKWRDVKGE